VDFDGRQQEASDSNQWDFSDLWALFPQLTPLGAAKCMVSPRGLLNVPILAS